MMAPDMWSWIWLLADQYPWVVAILAIVVLCFLGTVVACTLLGLARPEDDQRSHHSMPASNGNWRRSGGNWRGEL